MSADNPSLTQSIQKSHIINQTKLGSGAINNELLKNIEILEEENSQLKSALSELQEDLKDKENSIEESQKIITKLKDEYSKIIKELQNIESLNSKLTNENELNKKEIENAKKNNLLLSKLQNKNNDLTNEINILKKENISLKSKINVKNTTTDKNEKDLKNKEFIINNLKQKSDNWAGIIKEREKIIGEQSKKINELNEVISRQKEELKMVMNFSKNINKENRTNVSEITKQAVKTIKLFYNSLNNNYSGNTNENGYRIEFKNNNSNIFQEFQNILKDNKVSFLLEDAINSMMYIPKNLKSISKEFIMDMNLKTELIKSELYSSILRENQFIKYLKEIFGNFNSKDAENIKNLCRIIIRLKKTLENILKENDILKKNNKLLIEKNKNNDLFIKKFKNDVNNNINKIKEKYIYLINNISSKLENSEKNYLSIKEKAKKDYDKLTNEITDLKSENIELKNNIEEYKKLVDTQKENEKLFKSLEQKKINTDKYLNSFNNRLVSWNNNIKIESVNSINFIHSHIFKKLNINKRKINNYINYNDIRNISSENIKKNNYDKKKREIINLKEQIGRVKNEISNIMSTTVNRNEHFFTIPNKEDFDENDISSRSFIETKKNNDNNNKINNKINNLQKMLKKEKSKNINLEKENIALKKHINSLTPQFNTINSTNNTDMTINNNIFTPLFFVKIFFSINPKIFSSSELKKYYKIYDSNDINIIFDIFSESCECLKKQLYDNHFEFDSPNSDIEDNYIGSKNIDFDSSYRLVNEKILKLKKLEFDFDNLSEFVKNYLVSQEIIVKIIFNSDNDVIQFGPIEKLFNLFEECLNFKIDEMNDNVIFYRKLLIRIFKNQKNCLGLSLESFSQIEKFDK